MCTFGFSASLASCSFGLVIHLLISSAESFAPTPSSTPFLFPLPAIEWQGWHLLGADTALPFSTSWALDNAGTATNAASTAADANRFMTRLLSRPMCGSANAVSHQGAYIRLGVCQRQFDDQGVRARIAQPQGARKG